MTTSVILALHGDARIEVSSRHSTPVRKRQRTGSSERSSPGLALERSLESIRRLTLFLEVFERQSPENHVPLTGPLFASLDALTAVESDTRTSLNYPKQLVLSCLIAIVNGIKVRYPRTTLMQTTKMEVDPSIFHIDSLIACIRASANPQVHNRTLLLLSSLAGIVPHLILSHVMPIFTFMGTSVLRQDDEHSNHVIEQV